MDNVQHFADETSRSQGEHATDVGAVPFRAAVQIVVVRSISPEIETKPLRQRFADLRKKACLSPIDRTVNGLLGQFAPQGQGDQPGAAVDGVDSPSN